MPHFLTELVALVVASAAVAFIAQQVFRVVPLVGFLLAGVLIGPNALGLVRDMEMVEGAAELGVILLLFTIGMEFSLERLGRIRRWILVGGTLQVGLTTAIVSGICLLAGVGWRSAIYTGCLAALSSTVIVLKLLEDQGRMGRDDGKSALAILLFQDLIVIVMVLAVPLLGGESATLGDAGWALLKAVAIVAAVLVIARRLMPPFLERVARTCSQDIFLLTVVAVGFGTAWVSSLAGVSVSLGAFLAGLIVSESRFSEHAFSEMLPLRVLFSAAFFVSVGMLLDPGFLLQHPWIVLGIIAALLAIKVLTGFVSVRALGLAAPTAAATALLLAQVGEFSFILERAGRAVNLAPGGSEDLGAQGFIAASVVLMIATPLLANLGWGLQRRMERAGAATTREEGEAEAPDRELRDHIIIAGYGAHARRLVRALKDDRDRLLVLTLSPDGAREVEEQGIHVIRGDYSRRPILESAGLESAASLVISDDTLEMTVRVTAVARVLNPDLHIVVSAARGDEAAELRHAGASAVVTEEEAVSMLLARLVDPKGDTTASEALELEPAALDKCEHARAAGSAIPRTPRGCEECLQSGDSWVHLRLCLACGHVGCCDSSPNRHATKHFEESGHPVIRSLEPGETWGWCYVDRLQL